MPIPPGTQHGYSNIGTLTHHVPFIFGSLTLGGRGVFLVVDSRPRVAADLTVSPVTAAELNGGIPIGLPATIAARGGELLVLLDATLEEGQG